MDEIINRAVPWKLHCYHMKSINNYIPEPTNHIETGSGSEMWSS